MSNQIYTQHARGSHKGHRCTLRFAYRGKACVDCECGVKKIVTILRTLRKANEDSVEVEIE